MALGIRSSASSYLLRVDGWVLDFLPLLEIRDDLKAFPKGQLQDVLLEHLPRGDEIPRIGLSPERTAERLF